MPVGQDRFPEHNTTKSLMFFSNTGATDGACGAPGGRNLPGAMRVRATVPRLACAAPAANRVALYLPLSGKLPYMAPQS